MISIAIQNAVWYMPDECRTAPRDHGAGVVIPSRVFRPKNDVNQTRLDVRCVQKVEARAKYGLLGISLGAARSQKEPSTTRNVSTKVRK